MALLFQELIRHTLSESGIPEVRRLDGYIRDDVERYGTRLGDIERKLNNAWQDEVCFYYYWVHRSMQQHSDRVDRSMLTMTAPNMTRV